MGRRLVDGDALLRLTNETVRFNQILDRLRADVVAGHAAPASDAVLLHRLALRIDDVMVRFHGLNAALVIWHATLPECFARRQLVGNFVLPFIGIMFILVSLFIFIGPVI